MTHSLPSHINRFKIIDILGQGAQGLVFLALDPTSTRHVALKVLSEGNSTGVARARFLREFTSISRLSHPAVVAVYEQGDWDERPFFVMEYIPGTTIARHAVTLRRNPAAICRVMAIVADGLAHAHSRGVIHRDLKPANILVDRDGAPKISDFGMAKSLHGSVHLTQTSSIVGTMNYVSPEILRNDQIDPRSDLYSFGVILYELLTGELPFQSDSMIHLAMMHLTTPPPPLSERLKECPDSLSELLRGLLAKDPWERPATAELAARTLRTIADDLERSSAFVPSPSAPHGPPLVSRFTGRDAECDFLTGSIPESGPVPFSIRMIRGMGGTGKSRLVHEALNRINRRDIRTVQIPSVPIGSLPFESLEGLFSLMADSLERSPELMTELEGSLRDLPLISAHFNRVSPPCAPSPEEREKTDFKRLFRAIARILARLSAHSPWVIVIEDIQNADFAGLNLIDTLVTSAEITDFQCVWWFSIRIEDLHDSSAFSKWETSRGSQDRIRSFELAPLSFTESCRLVSSMIHQPEQSPDCMRLVSYGQGFPLILVETVRSLAHRGHLIPFADHWRFTEQQPESDTLIPVSLRDILKTRIDHLDPETLETLCWSALLDPEIDFRILKHLDEGPEDQILMRLDRLITQRFIEPYSNEQREYYRFCHHQLRDLLIDMLGERDVMNRHRDIATVLQTWPESGAPSHRIARHFESARQWMEAIRSWGQACCEAGERRQELKAIEFGDRAEAILEKHSADLPRLTQRLRLNYLSVYLKSLYNRSNYIRFIERFGATESLIRSLPNSQQVYLARLHIIACYMTGAIEAGDDALRRVTDTFPHADATETIHTVHVYRGLTLSDPRASFLAVMKLKRFLHSIGRPDKFQWTSFMIAHTLLQLRRYSVAERIFRATLERAIRDSNVELQASCLNGLGGLLIARHRMTEGADCFRKALAIHRQQADEYWISCDLHDLALIAHSEGRFDEARPLMEESLEFSIRRRLPRESAISIENLTQLCLELNDYGAIMRCVNLFDKAFPNHPETTNRHGFRARHAVALMMSGMVDQAFLEMRKAFRSRLQEKPKDARDLAMMLLAWSEMLRQKGHRPGADRIIEIIVKNSEHIDTVFTGHLLRLNRALTHHDPEGTGHALESIAGMSVQKVSGNAALIPIFDQFLSLSLAYCRNDRSICKPWVASMRSSKGVEAVWYRALEWFLIRIDRRDEADEARRKMQEVRERIADSLPGDRRDAYFSHDAFVPEWM